MKDKYVKQFITKLLDIKDEKEMFEFLQLMLTLEELEYIPRRLEILRMLKKGVPYREIAKKLGVALESVTRGNRALRTAKYKNI